MVSGCRTLSLSPNWDGTGRPQFPAFTAPGSRRTFSPPIPVPVMSRPALLRACLLCILLRVPVAPAEEPVYSAGQSVRGEEAYQQYCAVCHGARLQGNPAAPLSGETFRAHWEDGKHTLDDLYYIIRSLMPNNAPGSLSKAQYADIVAFILKANNYPAGDQELEPKAAVMKAVTLSPH